MFEEDYERATGEGMPEPEKGVDDVEVVYVGPAGSYLDYETGVRFKRNSPVVVEQEVADRLLQARAGTLFVQSY